VQTAVLKAFKEEKERSKLPGYVCTYDDYDNDYDDVSEPVRGYRTHLGHGPRSPHSQHEAATARQDKSGSFGAGIL
jgi:stage V sporulation protein G